jgi:hypothetical protein
MAVPEIECVIKSSTKNGRWFARILRSTQYDYRVRGPCLIA